MIPLFLAGEVAHRCTNRTALVAVTVAAAFALGARNAPLHVGPLVAMVLEGPEAVAAARQLIGATNPIEAAPGSIRGDYAVEVTFNLVHGSDSDESAEREIGIWFPELSD